MVRVGGLGGKTKLPEWIVEFKRRTAIIDIIIEAFESNCTCNVCKRLREIANELPSPFSTGLEPVSTTRRRRK